MHDVEEGRDAPAFVLLHGPKSDSWYWHLVVPGLLAAGSEAIAVDLPISDDACGLAEYAASVLDAIGSLTSPILVAHSMSAFVAPLIAESRPVRQIVLLAPMVPAPGERAVDWWANTAQREAFRAYAIEDGRDPDKPFDPVEVYLHDVPPSIVPAFGEHVRAQSTRPFEEPWPLKRWPDVPTRCVVGRFDRLFPMEFQRRVVRERLGIVPDVIDAGHLGALSGSAELTRLLLDDRS